MSICIRDKTVPVKWQQENWVCVNGSLSIYLLDIPSDGWLACEPFLSVFQGQADSMKQESNSVDSLTSHSDGDLCPLKNFFVRTAVTIFHSCDFLCCALNYDTEFFLILERLRLSINYNSAKEIGSNWNLMRRWLIILKRIFSTSSFRQKKFSRVTIYSARKINDWSSWSRWNENFQSNG